MTGSAMPAWKGRLTGAEISSVVAYIKKFSAEAFSSAPSSPVAVGNPPNATPDRLAAGKVIYQKMQCAKCHGEHGVGDGPSAAALKDDLGYPVPPANFTLGIFKGGDDPRDIYTRFTTGMLGSPMPSFGELLSDEERWNLTLYVKSLATESIIPDEPQTLVGRLIAKVTDNPYDPIWRKIPGVRIPLRPLWQRSQYTRFVEVRVAHDGKYIAVHMVWFDPTKDFSSVEVNRFRDAAAVQFPISDKPGFFGMGAVMSPSNIWHWTADAQEDVDRARHFQNSRDVEDAYPNMVVDAQPFSGAEWSAMPADARIRPAKVQDSTFISGWGSGNPLSNPDRKIPYIEYDAKGAGSLTAQPHALQSALEYNSEGMGKPARQPDESQNIASSGVWRGGVWTLVMLHELRSGDEMDVAFSPFGAERPVAFAIWDGDAGDRDGQKVVSQWHKIKLEP